MTDQTTQLTDDNGHPLCHYCGRDADVPVCHDEADEVNEVVMVERQGHIVHEVCWWNGR